MKYGVLIAALALAGAAALFLVLHQHPSQAAAATCAERQPKVVAFGDSLVAGYGAPQGAGFVDDLARSAGVPIRNLGVSGNTTADGLARIGDVLEVKPDIVIVLLGGNDALQQVPIEETQANLEAILKKLADAGAKVVLVAVPGGIVSDPYAAMYSRLAQEYGASYVPNVLWGLLGHADLMYDQIHPNEAGYRRVAADIYPALEKACAQ